MSEENKYKIAFETEQEVLMFEVTLDDNQKHYKLVKITGDVPESKDKQVIINSINDLINKLATLGIDLEEVLDEYYLV